MVVAIYWYFLGSRDAWESTVSSRYFRLDLICSFLADDDGGGGGGGGGEDSTTAAGATGSLLLLRAILWKKFRIKTKQVVAIFGEDFKFKKLFDLN